jgi:hypothetical protein
VSYFEDCPRNSGTNGHFNQGPPPEKVVFVEIRKRKEGDINLGEVRLKIAVKKYGYDFII